MIPAISAKTLRSGVIECLLALPITHSVTLKPNHAAERATEAFLRGALRTFDREVNKTLLGPRFNSPSKRHQRIAGWAIIEGLPFAGHIHAGVFVPRAHWDDFEQLFVPLTPNLNVNPVRANPWVARIKGGTSVADRISDAQGWVSYCTKELTNIDATDRLMFLPLDN